MRLLKLEISSIGMHVVLMMFTGYLVGYAAFRALFNHSAVMVTSKQSVSRLIHIFQYINLTLWNIKAFSQIWVSSWFTFFFFRMLLGAS